MTRAIVACIVTALVVAAVGACLLALGVECGFGGIACACRSMHFLVTAAVFGSALAIPSAVIGVGLADWFAWRALRRFVIAAAWLAPYAIVSRDVATLALGPACLLALVVEGWTRPPEPWLARATVMRR